MKKEFEYFDIIIIGAGVGGYSAALRAKKFNKKVAIIEKYQIGGTCLNRGCIPTKTLLSYVRNYKNSYRMFEDGIFGVAPIINEDKIMTEISDTIDKIRNGLSYTLKHDGVEVFWGTAIIIDPNTVIVSIDKDNLQLKTKTIIIATGSMPSIPKIDGLSEISFDTTDSIFKEKMSFNSMAIIGGGIIGIEFANVLSLLGKKVQVIEKMDRILASFPSEISSYAENILRKRGVNIICGGELMDIAEEDEEIILNIKSFENNNIILTDRMMFAVGRTANIEIIKNSEVNIKMDGNLISVDRNYQTNIKDIYAIGDVSSRFQLAYLASKQGEDVVDYIVHGNPCEEIKLFPQCVFMTPEIAIVGLNEDDLKAQNKKFIVGKASMSANGKAVLDGFPDGFMKILMDYETHTIIGGEFICENAVELSELLVQYIYNKITGESVLKTIFPHPSMVENVKNAILNGLYAGE